MEKKDIVSKFMKAGLLIQPQLLDSIEAGNIDSMIKDMKARGVVFVTEDDLERKARFAIKEFQQPKALKPADLAGAYIARYNALRGLLAKKVDAVSISNASSRGEVTVIAMVRELLPGGFVAEDLTGELEVSSSFDVARDDVVGVKGVVREGKLYASEVLMPEAPIQKPNRLDADVSLSLAGSGGSIGFGSESRSFSFPAMITLSKGIKILAYKPAAPIEQKDVVSMLRKRSIDAAYGESSVIEPVPDIFWVAQEPEWRQGHKGVLLISGKAVNVNLQTMG